VAGGSTQLHGVASDISCRVLSDLPEFGEGALKNALAYDEVTKAKYTKWSDNHSLFVDQLAGTLRKSASKRCRIPFRDGGHRSFAPRWMRIELPERRRAKKELQDDKLRKEMRSKERLGAKPGGAANLPLTLDTVDKPNLQLIMYPGKLAEAKKNGVSQKVDLKPRPMQIRI